MKEKPKVIDIFVECYWKLRDKSWDERKVTEREYVGKFHGGWNIVKCPGFPNINGGMGTPDMMALFPTEESVRYKFLKEYSEQYPEYTINVHLTVTADERNPTLDSFF